MYNLRVVFIEVLIVTNQNEYTYLRKSIQIRSACQWSSLKYFVILLIVSAFVGRFVRKLLICANVVWIQDHKNDWDGI